jgi:antitoxin VapB
MGITITNEEVERLASELARITGESVPDAVAASVRERLARVRRDQGAPLSERLLAIGREAAPLFPEDARSGDPTERLYGADGLPR